VGQSGATEEGLRAFGHFLPVTVIDARGGRRRVVERIDYAAKGDWRTFAAERHLPSDTEASICRFLDACIECALVRVEDVRPAWLTWLAREMR
jgi:hypothetical protein